MSKEECLRYSNRHFWLPGLLKFYVCVTHTHIRISQHPPACRCTWVCPLYGNFIYLSGTAPRVYISMNIITMSDLVENSALGLNSGSDVPEKCFTKDQIS